MKQSIYHTLISLALILTSISGCSDDDDNAPLLASMENSDLNIVETRVEVNSELDQLVMSIEVEGQAGNTYPTPAGQLDGPPVLGYVFPTTLSSADVGFGETTGTVAMALTSHPDFDDTPLWDENNDFDYLNDGRVWHSHWVLLVEDDRVEGGLSVKEFDENDDPVVLPPTNPGMPIYLDSPGFQVVAHSGSIKVVIPLERINNRQDFNFDGVTAALRVNTSDGSLPMLGVYEVYDVASGDLSLPYRVN